MLKRTYLKQDQITYCSISVLWEIDSRIDLSKIILKLTKHSPLPEVLGSIEISSNAIGYDLTSLSPSTIYEIQIAPCDNKRQYSWSNILICTTSKPPAYNLYYPSEKLIVNNRQNLTYVEVDSTEIINARGIKDWKDYVNCGYKFARPREKKNIIMKRMLNYVHVTDFLEEKQMIPNDNCFQGPFVVKLTKD